MFRSRLKRFITAGLLIALAFNLIAVGVLLWSRDGQTTVVELESHGGVYRVLVDGWPVEFNTGEDPRPKSLPLDGPESGTIRLLPPTPLSTFADPSGIDSVVVLDVDGEELFSDDFDQLDRETWTVDSGSFVIDDGVLVPQNVSELNSITLNDEGWRDYTLQVTYKNSRGGQIASHITETGGVYYHFELIRDFPNFLDVFNDQGRAGMFYGDFIHTDSQETLQSIGAMALEPYPYLIAAALAGLALTFLLSRAEPLMTRRLSTIDWASVPWRRHLPLAAALAIAGSAFALVLAISWHYYGFVPHYPDEVMYAFQAKMIAAGRFTTEMFGPSDAYFISTIKPSFIDDIGEWATFYPFGHPMALAVGAFFGLTWFVPPVIGAGTVFLTYWLGRHFFGVMAGLLATLMLAISPFFWMQAGNLLSHNTGTLYILLALVFIVKRDRPVLYGVLAGLFFGLGINTRPLNMVALTLPYGALMLGYLYARRNEPMPWLKHAGAFVAATLLMVLAMLAYNYGVTGELLGSTYTGADDASQLYGFREGHTIDLGIRNEQAQLSTLLLVFTGWPVFVGLAFVMLPFLLGSRNRWDYFVLACALIQILAYAGYRYSGVFEGPRYWYEAMPFLALLAGRGIQMVGLALNAAVGWVQTRFQPRTASPAIAGHFVVLSLVAVLIAWGTGGWLFGWNEVQDSPNVPYRADAIDGVFGIDNRLDELADSLELENALVLVEPCGFFQSSNCFGSVFLRNNVDFDSDIVWLYYLKDRHEETIAAFPGRDVYIASWDPGASIRPYEPPDSAETP